MVARVRSGAAQNRPKYSNFAENNSGVAIMVKVSVITVVWNAAAELEKTLANLAALDRSAAELEVIVIDGGSTDGTQAVMERFRKTIAYAASERDEGLYDAMNKGIRAATGDYLWFVNAGDRVFRRDALTRIFPAGRPLADVYYGETLVETPSGEVLGLRKKRLPRGGLTWRSLTEGMVVCHQSFLVRRAIAPLYDTDRYRLAADIDWVIECLKRAGSVVDTGIVLSCFTTGGISTRRRRASWRERWKIMVKHYGWWRTLRAHAGFAGGMLLDRLLRRPACRPFAGE